MQGAKSSGDIWRAMVIKRARGDGDLGAMVIGGDGDVQDIMVAHKENGVQRAMVISSARGNHDAQVAM